MDIHKFESIPSTNSALVEFSKKNAKSWTVFWTSNQTNGRGYSGNQWLIQPDENLAVSVLIKSELAYQELIYFNQWVSNCLQESISEYGGNVCVKWPNDIILNDKKVCGVLIETHKSGNELNMIVGMGVNVNQMEFGDLSKATSLAKIHQRKFEIEEILSALLTKMVNSYSLVLEKDWSTIRDHYNIHLFRKNEISTFRRDGEEFEGIIRSVDEYGLLEVELKDLSICKFQHKEIELDY
jgi:BirA family biotin operon repressor/biotin-[acetyl-CoA-carboxylase] ligase